MEKKFFRRCVEIASINPGQTNRFVGVAQLKDKSGNKNTTSLTVEQRTCAGLSASCDLSDGKQTLAPTKYHLPRRF